MMKKIIPVILLLTGHAMTTWADEDEKDPCVLNDIEYNVALQASGTTGDHTPLWLNANQYGLSSLEKANGYVRAGIRRTLDKEHSKKWDLGYGIDVAGAFHYTSSLVIQQLYAEGRWLNGVLTVGSKEWAMELKNNDLSTGSQTLGKNARPVPQVRIALPDYWSIPGTNGWIGLKGHIAYGKMTDDNWQKDFTRQQSKYTENVLYHSKAGYIRIGNEELFVPFSLELGLEMATQFGGTSYSVNAEGGTYNKIENSSGLNAFWHAFIPGGADSPEQNYQNMSGNHVGSWLFRLNLDYDSWYFGLYGDHFFEDQSAMFLLDYDGYGQGEECNIKKNNRYLLYSLKDMMLGAELKLKEATWLNDIVFEYIYTKYQSGPIYHDRNQNISDHIGGIDDYYNHYIYTGWQHWGQVMGNPLYRSPIYNEDGTIEVKNNRFYAFHMGLSGDPSENLHYRLLATYQKGFGRYHQPFRDPQESLSLLAEAAFHFPEDSKLYGWSLKAGCGVDLGQTYGKNYGLQITVAKTGMFNLKKKKK